mgnify:CR=1 FL=1
MIFINSFDNVFQVVEKSYNENRKFPDMEWLRLRFMDVREIIEYPNPFSMQIYESFLRFNIFTSPYYITKRADMQDVCRFLSRNMRQICIINRREALVNLTYRVDSG